MSTCSARTAESASVCGAGGERAMAEIHLDIDSPDELLVTDEDLQQAEQPAVGVRSTWTGLARATAGVLVGTAILVAPMRFPQLADHGWQALGPLLGIMLVVWSLFGDLPRWISWTQLVGGWLVPGVALGTVLLLLPLWPDSRWAPSPRVWAAYVSIVLVSIAFEYSSLPTHIYRWCSALPVGPGTVIPIYVVVAGLLGNVLDGVSIIAISVVIFLHLLSREWAMRAAFALLFGGLISNLVTIAAEPTNIKFQDVLFPVLDRVAPSYWLTNWPISVLGILLPAGWLFVQMRQGGVGWHRHEPHLMVPTGSTWVRRWEVALSVAALLALATGIIVHSVTQAQDLSGTQPPPPGLWKFLLPAGILATIYTVLTWRRLAAAGKVTIHLDLWNKHWERRPAIPATMQHIIFELPVWLKLMIIFSLLWFLGNGLQQPGNAFAQFFQLPEALRFGGMIVLSLFSSVTDNVALAAMQGSLLLNHPLSVWQIRLLFVLLAWAGGFTPFGCLQSLALNSRLKLSTREWFGQCLTWGGLSLVGGLVGLVAIALLYPTDVGRP